ncbi:hypothetical protein Mal4_02180 [Maioricimonas rarisocia]|uniref:Uncharacterized protein n=1 Tax=Maioricimonas rarisocia TaxID=2528026 RepID=A0A517Z0C8_9PLAN|nr:hypothetical protein Mal4_02180 [Maioricimonas rarisocia]
MWEPDAFRADPDDGPAAAFYQREVHPAWHRELTQN